MRLLRQTGSSTNVHHVALAPGLGREPCAYRVADVDSRTHDTIHVAYAEEPLFQRYDDAGRECARRAPEHKAFLPPAMS